MSGAPDASVNAPGRLPPPLHDGGGRCKGALETVLWRRAAGATGGCNNWLLARPCHAPHLIVKRVFNGTGVKHVWQLLHGLLAHRPLHSLLKPTARPALAAAVMTLLLSLPLPSPQGMIGRTALPLLVRSCAPAMPESDVRYACLMTECALPKHSAYSQEVRFGGRGAWGGEHATGESEQ